MLALCGVDIQPGYMILSKTKKLKHLEKMKKLIPAIMLAISVCSGIVFADVMTNKFSYDALNRLTNVTYGNGTSISYTYDALGNRTSEKVTTNSQPKKVALQVQEVTPQQAKDAVNKIQQLAISHPEPLVREKLFGWIDHGVLFAANNLFPEMNSSVEKKEGKDQVLLWYSIPFILDVPNVANPDDKQAYLQLCVYHEAVHIDDHMSGRLPLPSLVSGKPLPSDEMAQNVWDREWSAVTKEWALAKKLKKTHLVPVIYAATKNGETSRTFLDGFYKLQMQGDAVALNPSLASGFTKCYKKELEKLK